MEIEVPRGKRVKQTIVKESSVEVVFEDDPKPEVGKWYRDRVSGMWGRCFDVLRVCAWFTPLGGSSYVVGEGYWGRLEEIEPFELIAEYTVAGHGGRWVLKREYMPKELGGEA